MGIMVQVPKMQFFDVGDLSHALRRFWIIMMIILHYIFVISQLWLTSHPRSTVVLLDTGTPGTSREIYSDDAEVQFHHDYS